MKLPIAENLRALRTAHRLTQESLAEALGVSAQSVSRWEQGVCYPDIELLPAIANFFDATLDELLGMDMLRSRQRRDAIFTAALDAERAGNLAASEAILRSTLTIDPADDALQAQLALVLSQSDAQKDLAEAVQLSENVLESSHNEKLCHTVRANLCVLYKAVGQPERAEALVRTLPHLWECREVLLPYILSDREAALQSFHSILEQVQCDVESDEPIPFSLGYAPQKH